MLMILIGENLNVMSPKINKALKEFDPGPIREVALAEAAAGVDILNVNPGPLRKGPELMEWMVRTVQEVVDLPLFLDTMSVQGLEAGLKASKGKAYINSISARPERMEALMPLAKMYNAGFVALTIGIEGIPRDAAERGFLAAEIMAEAGKYGLREDDIWIDPVVLPVNSQQIQVQGCTEFVMMLHDLCQGCKSTCGLSNVSNGAPAELRGIMNRTYLIILKRYGLYSAIVNAFDKEMNAIARGERPELEALVRGVMDGEMHDVSSLSEAERAYVKTATMLLGHTVYSDSWLEI